MAEMWQDCDQQNATPRGSQGGRMRPPKRSKKPI